MNKLFFALLLLASCSPAKQKVIKVYLIPWEVSMELMQFENSVRNLDTCQLFTNTITDSKLITELEDFVRGYSSKDGSQLTCSNDIHLVCDILENDQITKAISFSSKTCFFISKGLYKDPYRDHYLNKDTYQDNDEFYTFMQRLLPPEHNKGMKWLPIYQGKCDYSKYYDIK